MVKALKKAAGAVGALAEKVVYIALAAMVILALAIAAQNGGEAFMEYRAEQQATDQRIDEAKRLRCAAKFPDAVERFCSTPEELDYWGTP